MFPKFLPPADLQLDRLKPRNVTWTGGTLFAQLLLLFPFNICVRVCVCVAAGGVAGPVKWNPSGYVCVCVWPTATYVQFESPLSLLRWGGESKQQNSKWRKKLKIALSPVGSMEYFYFPAESPPTPHSAPTCVSKWEWFMHSEPSSHKTLNRSTCHWITPRQMRVAPKLQLHVLVDSAEWLFSSVWICVLLRHKHYTNICKFWGLLG